MTATELVRGEIEDEMDIEIVHRVLHKMGFSDDEIAKAVFCEIARVISQS